MKYGMRREGVFGVPYFALLPPDSPPPAALPCAEGLLHGQAQASRCPSSPPRREPSQARRRVRQGNTGP